MTGVELSNTALLKLSSKMIANFTDTPIGEICGMLLQQCLDEFYTNMVWPFNEAKATLTPNQVEDPDNPGEYINEEGSALNYLFTLPNDCLAVRRVYDANGDEIFNCWYPTISSIESDEETIDIEYTRRISGDADGEVGIPAYTTDAFTSYFAHRIAPVIKNGTNEEVKALLQDANDKAYSAYITAMQMYRTKIDRGNYNNRG